MVAFEIEIPQPVQRGERGHDAVIPQVVVRQRKPPDTFPLLADLVSEEFHLLIADAVQLVTAEIQCLAPIARSLQRLA